LTESKPYAAHRLNPSGAAQLLSDRSHVRILDTARWEDEPIAICRFPEWVPMTFHGLWLPG
jgi:carotenoid cleavage dioxygenase-like enzyme